MFSLYFSEGSLPYSGFLQQEGNRTKSSPPTSPLFEANKVVIMVIARSAPGPAPQDIALGRSLFGEKNFYIVYSDQSASESALLLKNADIEARLSDRRYSFTASEILAEARNLQADQQDSESADLNLELSAVVDQALSCPIK